MQKAWLAILFAACSAESESPQTPDATVSIDTQTCVPESDADLCARVAGCEAQAIDDNCGVTRTVDCGGCSGGKACVANQCRTPQCNSFAFPNMSLVTSINADGVQDAVGAISADGSSVINQRRNCATGFTTLLIDDMGLTTATIDLSANSAFAQTRHAAEGTFAMSGDALTVVGVNATSLSFLSSTRPAKGSSAFPTAAVNDFANIAVTAPAVVIHPALSADGLAFYYTVRSSGDAAIDGIYESVRTSTSATFPFATRMGGDVQAFDYVTGVSGDKMALFVQKGFAVSALTRTSVTRPFTNPNAPAAAPALPGFRTRPIADCTMLLGTCTAGCNNEQTCTFTP